MEPSSLIWAFGGFIAGNVLVSLLSTWARAIVEVLRDREPGRRWGMVFATSLFNAGPWALVAAGIFTFYEYSAPWAPWFFGGAGVWIVLTGLLLAFAMWKQRRAKEENAA